MREDRAMTKRGGQQKARNRKKVEDLSVKLAETVTGGDTKPATKPTTTTTNSQPYLQFTFGTVFTT
jgi:hypothetical protein